MGDRPDKRQELQSALDAVTTTFAAARPVSPAATPSPPAAPADGKQELASAYDRLVEHEAAKPTSFIPPLPATWRRYLRPAIIVVSVTIAIYLTINRPAWLYPTFELPEDPATETAAEQILTATSLLVEQYQQQYGRLPAKLSDIDGSFPSVSLMDTGGGSYRLLSAVGDRSVVMTITPGQDPTLESGRR